MAAEVPAKDVLCEAMEYLSKLGSNLRTRSDSLREKKIRREKLNNVIAVQKAASKVLLICELSKRSLENVETGVRKVLDLIDISQATSSDGGKKNVPRNEEEKKSKSQKDDTIYYYIKYKSRKLKIKNRISFKHYNSVRVYAKSLPKSMIDKYPVHYDCKLYRMRKKEAKLQRLKEEACLINQEDKDLSVISIPDTPDPNSTKNKCNEEKFDKALDKNISIISIPDSPEPKVDTARKSGKSKDKEIGRDSSIESTKEQSTNKYEEKYEKSRSDKDSLKSSHSPLKSSHSPEKKQDSESENSEKEESRKKSSKRKRVISESSSENEKGASKDNDSDVACCESESKKPKLNEDSNDGIKSTIEENNCEKNKDDDDDSNKPKIKLVSLSKLLKPDLLAKEKKKHGPHSKPKENRKETKSTQKEDKAQQENVRKSEKQAKKEREEEEYWAQKRKEVKAFEPKSFVINVTKLPEVSQNYLNKLGLKKITSCGVTICEISNEDLDGTEHNNSDAQTLEKRAESNSRRVSNSSNDDALIDEANKVKKSLLNESDSDEMISSGNESKSSKTKTDHIKRALLNDSDSDNKKSEGESHSSGNNEKDKKSVNDIDQTQKQNQNSDDSGSQSDKCEPESSAVQEDIAKTCRPQTSRESDNESVDEKGKEENNEGTVKNNSYGEHDNNSKKENSKDKDSDDSVEKNNECLRNDDEKTPEKNSSPNKDLDPDKDIAKSSLLNDSSSDDKTKTPLNKRLTPQSKKKRLRESVEAKKMLLGFSGSDTEDEQSANALKEIKNSLLNGSDEENKEEKKVKGSSHSSSEDDLEKKVKVKLRSDKQKRPKHKKNKHPRKLASSSENSDHSNTNESQMVRSKSKPGNSSCQNSDAPDSSDKDIDGLTNLKSLSKPRRRNSNSSELSEESHSTAKSKMSKAKVKPSGLIAEEILKAESSSESAAESAEENVDNDADDMPEVTVPSFNGVGEHLVKEDLLGESDSSDEKSGDKDETDSEERPKRRKAILSSDSEVGSSRKKDPEVKMSDFEDSDDSITNKRSKRKKKAVDSDASVGSGSSNEEGKKKRRRIKSVRDSDASGSESETEGRNKHGRKNIRKVMGKNQLEEATKKAARQEKERIARIAERQKMYNNLQFDESGKPDEVVLDKVVLDFDPETKEPLIEVDRGLVKKLKPHQANGIKFMWDACFESVKRIRKDRGSGCILAHCMGLGKTLQVVTLTHTLLTHGDLTSVNRVLVVCPLSTVLNWVNEFKMWLKYAETEFDVDVYELSRFKQNSERAFQLSQWFRHGGVCVLGYEMFRNLSADNSKKYKKKMLTSFQEALVDPGPDLVVCDEGHLLKNEKTSLSQSMNRVKTLRRIVLTGTPLQNNLKEYYCMVQFVKPNLLGKYNEYLNRFVNPITNGQYTDSTEHDIKIMKRRSHVLHKMLDGAVQRRDYGVLAPFLPPKHEYVLFITLSEVQTRLYQHYLDNFSRKPLPGKSSGFLFPDFQSLQRIWTHPLVLKYNSERYEIMQQKKRDKEEEEDSEGSLRDFIDDDSTSEESMSDDSTDDSSDMSDDSRKKSKKKKKAAKKSKGKDKEAKGDGVSRPRRGTRANPVEIDDEDNKVDDIIELKNENPTEWWIKLVTDDELEDMRNSHKLVLLFDILRQCEAIGDKLLVFSQSLYSLDLIEHFLGKVDDATQEGRIDEKLGGHIGTWSPGVDYFRLDGSTSCENRSIWCKNFNREDNPRARLFLISTRAGGLGINLVAANRVVIFDVSWNPSHDVQSIFRVYRFGQKKPCYVYRFLAMGTMEEKIYERQVTKQAISKRVIDEQQIDRHYAENDLAELYKFEPQPPTPRPIPPLPKDRLFAEMLREHEVQIYKYHEHDSLLENKEEETLSEEERKAAWEDFENEKNKPPPAPFPSTWQANIFQQQQQLTFAALAAMLRKDMPNVSDNQLRDMIPLIYNSNPQLMQKLSEIYKYSPAMMNPGMMNPAVMNAGVGVGGMGGGASGLQYEPPWQRQQQQQQQQMRLQQLLQHQNPMGAKFYAGGLGSRDPVAMALQHQRAREIMMGNSAASAGRPRGRPPLQPRAPPPADVVNLDSD